MLETAGLLRPPTSSKRHQRHRSKGICVHLHNITKWSVLKTVFFYWENSPSLIFCYYSCSRCISGVTAPLFAVNQLLIWPGLAAMWPQFFTCWGLNESWSWGCLGWPEVLLYPSMSFLENRFSSHFIGCFFPFGVTYGFGILLKGTSPVLCTCSGTSAYCQNTWLS